MATCQSLVIYVQLFCIPRSHQWSTNMQDSASPKFGPHYYSGQQRHRAAPVSKVVRVQAGGPGEPQMRFPRGACGIINSTTADEWISLLSPWTFCSVAQQRLLCLLWVGKHCYAHKGANSDLVPSPMTHISTWMWPKQQAEAGWAGWQLPQLTDTFSSAFQ